MSAVLDRSELEQSPLADLHLLANELGVDGFRRLRKEELIDQIADLESRMETGAIAESRYKQELKDLKFRLSKLLEKIGPKSQT